MSYEMFRFMFQLNSDIYISVSTRIKLYSFKDFYTIVKHCSKCKKCSIKVEFDVPHVCEFLNSNYSTESTSTKVIVLFYLHCLFANSNAGSHDQPDNLIKTSHISNDSNSLSQTLSACSVILTTAKNLSVRTSRNSSVDFSDLLQAVVTPLLSSVSNRIDTDCFINVPQPCWHQRATRLFQPVSTGLPEHGDFNRQDTSCKQLASAR